MKSGLLFIGTFCSAASTSFAQDLPTAVSEDAPPTGTYSTSPEFRYFREPASPEDRAAIRDLMRRYGDARRSHDAKALAATFAEDAELTNGFGDVIRGSDNIERFMTWVFAHDDRDAGMAQAPLEIYRPLSVRYLGDDVAIVHGMTQSASGGGPQSSHHQTWVLSKENAQWRIVHQQNSDVSN